MDTSSVAFLVLVTAMAVVLSVAASVSGVFGQELRREHLKPPTLLSPDGLGLLIPPMNASRGRTLFATKGCVICHSVNGVGGGISSNLDANEQTRVVNPYDFAARMWRGASAMARLQNKDLGYQIDFDGRELADLAAFAHDRSEQKRFSEDDIPAPIRELLRLRNL